jgi:hypothetical protein
MVSGILQAAKKGFCGFALYGLVCWPICVGRAATLPHPVTNGNKKGETALLAVSL